MRILRISLLISLAVLGSAWAQGPASLSKADRIALCEQKVDVPFDPADLPPLRVTQESVFHFAPRDAHSWWPSLIHHHDGATVYGLETPSVGVKLAEHHTGPVVDPDTRDGMVDPGSRERVVQFVERWMPGLAPVPVDETTCLYTTTPTEDFVIDRVGPVVVASPCSGHGFKFSPLVGQMIADVVAGGYAPERFRLHR